MSSEWRIPVGVGQEDEASGSDNSEHLRQEGVGSRHVLDNVGRVADIEHTCGDRQICPSPTMASIVGMPSEERVACRSSTPQQFAPNLLKASPK